MDKIQGKARRKGRATDRGFITTFEEAAATGLATLESCHTPLRPSWVTSAASGAVWLAVTTSPATKGKKGLPSTCGALTLSGLVS